MNSATKAPPGFRWISLWDGIKLESTLTNGAIAHTQELRDGWIWSCRWESGRCKSREEAKAAILAANARQNP